MLYPQPNRGQNNQGFTLIELLIGGSLGLIVLLGITELFVQAKVSFKTNESLARMQEDMRLAQQFIRNNSQRGGHNNWVPTIPSGSTVSYSVAGTMTLVAPVSVDATTDNTGASGSDILIVKYWSNTSGETDCDGTAVDTTVGTYVTNTFQLDNSSTNCEKDSSGNDTMALTCNSQPIICGVSGLQVVYGVDSNDDGSVNYFVTGASVSSPMSVSAIRTTLTFTDLADGDNLADQSISTTTYFRKH